MTTATNDEYMAKLDKLDRESDLEAYWDREEKEHPQYYYMCLTLALIETQFKKKWEDTNLETLIKRRWPDMYNSGPSDLRFGIARKLIGVGV